MQNIRDFQDARAVAHAVDVDRIPDPAPYAREHVAKLTAQGYAGRVIRQLVREVQSSRRTRDLESLDKNAKSLSIAALTDGLERFANRLTECVVTKTGKVLPIRHHGYTNNPVNALQPEQQAGITWDAVCAMLGRMVLIDRPLAVETLAGNLARRLQSACRNADPYGTLGYERAALVLLDHFREATGWIVEISGRFDTAKGNAEGKKGKRVKDITPNTYRLTQGFLDDVLGGELAADFSEFSPMLVPPVPWTESAYHGGYLSRGVQAVRGLQDKAIGSPEIVAALNALQATPFRVNQRVLAVAERFRFNAEDARTIRVAGRVIDAVHMANPDETRSKVIRSALTLAAVRDLADEDEFYFPWNLDWRGRMYPATTILSPQGSDLCKGLIEFADGTPLGRDGARWLAIHICNLAGAEKVTIDGEKVHRTPDERYNWTLDNREAIRAVAADPWHNRDWQQADKPWQYLAACIEWEGFETEGNLFRSRLAGALDGSCSGVQMLSGMTRDESAGAMVNLVPAPRGDDYYGRMAEALIERLGKLEWHTDEETRTRLAFWRKQKIDRDLLKAPSMTKVYSAGTYTFGEQVSDKSGADLGNAMWLARQINSCFESVAPAMLRAMNYVQAVSDVLTDAGEVLEWETPAGLAVVQSRRKAKTQEIKTGGDHARNVYLFVIDLPELNKQAQRAGVSPNFVHGVDASHMVYVINDLHARGVRNFWMIHDSFGAPFAQCGEVYESTREQFARLMTPDLLGRWTEQVTAVLTPEQKEKLPSLPEYGTLDLQQVKESIYAWF